MVKVAFSAHAPKPIGPYSQGIMAKGQGYLFISGQLPINPDTMAIETVDVREQAKVVLRNIAAILKSENLGSHHVVKATVFLKSMNDFALVNEEYERFFVEHKPARTCIEVSRLPKDALVEIDAIAMY